MTETKNASRLPFYLLLIGVFLISSFAVYIYQNRSSAASSDSSAASKDADDAVAAAGMSDAERKATEALVRAYILENPEIITEAIGVLQSREMAQRLESVGDAIKTPFAGDVAGNPNGDITIVEFTDYNCGFCRQTVADVDQLLKSDGNIRLIYREIPILKPSSRTAALWALAAAKQGKHDAFHRAMFAAGKPDDATIRKAAQNVGLDMAAAEKFASSAEANAELDNNLAMMQQIGFNGTPTFIIGNQIIEGAQGFDRLNAAIKKARESKS
ncbi:DsbA family protein [Sphingorhabdus arenilitoris]|uniref:DsbA family protein n=1 Tax=Sphingorhabdus arenilitoris TaxID=1490041 RepID=A0ABV8REI5_9SPHN